jgi:hypothetical protein
MADENTPAEYWNPVAKQWLRGTFLGLDSDGNARIAPESGGEAGIVARKFVRCLVDKS